MLQYRGAEMRILYAVQGTGNGHISRSREVIKYLSGMASVDVLVSEKQHEIDLGVDIKYRLSGLGFVFGKKGGIDYIGSLRNARPNRFLSDVYALPVEKYDIVISDFEPVSAWACKLKKKPHISLSHQAAFFSDRIPRPEKINNFYEFVIRWYAPFSVPIGLHFQRYDDFILTPVIREEIRNCDVINRGHYTVYLPSFDEKYVKDYLSRIDVKWEMFSKHYKGTPYTEKNVTVYPVSNECFVKSFSSCAGILCNSGFETPSEALYLGKKILAIPMKGQYEQECNAVALKSMGMQILDSINKENLPVLEQWINSASFFRADYEDNREEIAELIFDHYYDWSGEFHSKYKEAEERTGLSESRL